MSHEQIEELIAGRLRMSTRELGVFRLVRAYHVERRAAELVEKAGKRRPRRRIAQVLHDLERNSTLLEQRQSSSRLAATRVMINFRFHR